MTTDVEITDPLVGTKPNQVPANGMLGSAAYRESQEFLERSPAPLAYDRGPIYVPGVGVMEWDEGLGAYVVKMGGATGGGADQIFHLNQQAITQNYTIPQGMNAGTFGDVEIAPGVEVTISEGSTWTVA